MLPTSRLRNHFLTKKGHGATSSLTLNYLLLEALGVPPPRPASLLPAGLLFLQDLEKSKDKWLIDEQNRLGFVVGILPWSAITPYMLSERFVAFFVSTF